MQKEVDTTAPFREFSEANGNYYASTFLKLQRNELSAWHLNWAAGLGSFIWAALRGNWLLFWISLAVDLIGFTNIALIYKYATAAAQATADGKDYLVTRYENWTNLHTVAAILAFVLGRLLVAWLADRLYYRQYAIWRVDRNHPSGTAMRRVLLALLVVALVAPLTLYRASQFAPDQRTCLKQARAIQDGKQVSFKDRFDCSTISEVPTLVWLKRPVQYEYPRNEDGTRSIVVREQTAKRPVNLNTYASETIDQAITYAKVFYGWFFDGITHWLRVMLNAIEAVFVGTPWPVVAGMFLLIAYSFAGPRIATFVGVSLIYIALFGFWQTGMSTIAIVVASTIICVVVGLPLGIWVGKSRRASTVVTPILDIMQTIPSFVYLLPAVAFFSIGKPPGIMATVIFSMPPMVRLTALGIRQVPESTKEAALAFGANPRQLLTKVELPLALASIMAGVNQVVMMSLSMAVVAALIGAGGLGFIVVEALQNTETGRGILAGIAIALIAMMIDRVVQKANKVEM
ncbi:MAG: proline/glycine betaine ABC transporter permease [Erythrobacter sp.]|nr:proline/glycine betaine ABC transporter permease [Erythrobacter sp.]